ncbi:rhodanese-like domain-containing protein [Streptomyces sp. NPDC056222]|uniref:rhodanese-like domain-containing protein n=1 Tax=Streptomyces sp. NPDC056222 TaxID=3345749 RepID=UPI0035E25403
MLFSRRGPGRITPSEAYRLVRDRTAALLDVREADEYQAGHAPGALHVPLSRLAAAGADTPGSRDGHSLVLICRSGKRSRQAARLLAERGVEAVDVTGGMIAWAEEGLPVQDAHGQAGTVI